VNSYRTVLALLVFMALWPLTSGAVIETYEFSDPVLEERYQSLSLELRCPKCQNQNIADSDAPISRDLRSLLHQQLEAGATDEEILGYMVLRYGDFVRYRPAVNEKTALLWFGPIGLIIVGIGVFIWHFRRARSAPNADALTDDERALLERQRRRE
jgi:cytochrome c-type biogenesis protein CcmH